MKYIINLGCCFILFFAFIACGTDSTIGSISERDSNEGTIKAISNDQTIEIEQGDDKVIPTNESQGLKPNKSGPEDDKIQRIGFYNVENLFDTKDDANKEDQEFLPKSKNEWTEEKYTKKLQHLAKVIDYMGQPGIMGLCEVENEHTLKDIIKQSSLKDAKYAFVHHESPDVRGIDVALLYSKDEYDLMAKDFIKIDFPKNVVVDYTTREILHATLKNKKKEFIHVFVCHWPSRRGGVEESEPKRLYVAQQVRKEVDKIFEEYDDNHVVIIGDFNDEPSNKSVNQILSAKPEVSDPKPEELYNLMYELDRKGLGSYNYRGEWNMLDQIIVSGSLLDKKKTDVINPSVFNRDWMLFYHKKTSQYRPNRTFSGGKYYGGYSDHLPVSVDIK